VDLQRGALVVLRLNAMMLPLLLSFAKFFIIVQRSRDLTLSIAKVSTITLLDCKEKGQRRRLRVLVSYDSSRLRFCGDERLALCGSLRRAGCG
jgi:hypothetical protein